MKSLIFISHSTHQDDYCAAWLTSKLKAIGYNAWIDLKDLSAGDSFNSVIKPIIQQQAKIFIPITTRSYSEKSENQNSGVSRELNCAATVDTKSLGHNFIIPVKFDDVDYNNFPYQYLGWNTIDFSHNWQDGLIDLVRELEKINFEDLNKSTDPITLWFEAIKAEKKPINRNEHYYSNWFPFILPEHIHVHNPKMFIPQDIYQIPFPFVTDSNRIVSFASQQTIQKFIALESSYTLDSSQFLQENEIGFDDGFVLKDCKNKLTWLLNNAIQKHLQKCNLICWKRGKSKLFYFRHPKNSSGEFVSLRRYNKPRGRRAVTGQVNPTIDEKKVLVNWSFGIIPKAELLPFPHFRISYSLVFSDINYKRFEKGTHHKLRRTVPVDWFNRKWFETLLASILKLSPSIDSENIKIEIDENSFWEFSNEPFNGESNKGYIEPQDDES